MKTVLTLIGVLAISSCLMAQTSVTGQASSTTNASGTMQGSSAAGQAVTSTSGTAGAAGQSASASAQQSIQAELTKSIDAKKAKSGDMVEAKSLGAFQGAGGVNIPKGSKLIGHVTDVKARSKESQESTLGIMFDQAIVKGGQTVPLHAVIAAAMAPRPMAAPSVDTGMDSSANATPGAPPAGASGGPLGRAGDAVGGVANTAGRTVGGVASSTTGAVGSVGRDAGSTLGTQSTADVGANVGGVAGLPGVTLSAQSSDQASGSVFRSSSQNVRLESGTTLLLRVVAE